MFPWQLAQWQQLARAVTGNRLPHALLLTGMAGTGKALFAQHIARALLCQQTNFWEQPEAHCDCHACHLLASGAHPNALKVEPEKSGQAIKVDQIREVTEFVQQTALKKGHRIVTIQPADKMNANAANALLKTLEEPAPHALLLLISAQHSALPATILSRCQRLAFPLPPREQGLAWVKKEMKDKALDPALLLTLAHGAPLAALRLIEEENLDWRKQVFTALTALSQKDDPLRWANKLKEIDYLPLLDLLLSWVMDLLRLQLGEKAENITNHDFASELSQLHSQISIKNSAALLQSLQQYRHQIGGGFNLNKQLLLESVFIQWVAMFKEGRQHVSG